MKKIILLSALTLFSFSLISCNKNESSKIDENSNIEENSSKEENETNQNNDDNSNTNEDNQTENNEHNNKNELKPFEIVNKAILNYENTPNHYAVTKGKVDAGLDIQSVDTVSGRVNDAYFMESISAGKFVSVGKRFYEYDNKSYEYTGKPINKTNLTATWSDEIKFETNEEFEEKWGKKVSKSSIYIINSDTVTKETITKDENDNYFISLTLDHEKATANYSKQIIHMSNLKQPPKFYSLEIDYKITSDFNLISREVRENYDIQKLGKHNSDGILNETYYIGNFKIPNLETNCTFYK